MLTYCTNVHAGRNLAETEANLDRFAPRVRELTAPETEPDAPIGLGLWLSASSARELRADGGAAGLRDRLLAKGLHVVTFNGFPYGDFHADVVKHAVYEPHWADPKRLAYTIDLANLLVDLLPDGVTEASISTLPIGWRTSFTNEGCGCSVGMAAAQLVEAAKALRALEDRTGVCIHLDLEPEPGCVLDVSQDVVDLFEQAFRPSDGVDHRRYLRVCHDVCHAAVMFEPQTAALRTYREHEIGVGKIQVSSAIEVDFDAIDDEEERARTLDAYRGFVEPRYLHQTMIRTGVEPHFDAEFFEDLPIAIANRAEHQVPTGIWRTHFHVPIFTQGMNGWSSTQTEIERCLAALPKDLPLPMLEVETYAWDVLPNCLYAGDEGLAAGIAEELRWLRGTIETIRGGIEP
jgi:sugar phosphate isomerase/epimerase